MWELSWILLALHSITAVKSQRLVIGDWITVEFDTNFPLTQIGRYNSGWYNAITPETMLIVAFSFGFTRASHPIRHDKITSQWPQVNSCDRQWKYPTDQNPSSSRIVLELRARVYPENGLPFRKKKFIRRGTNLPYNKKLLGAPSVVSTPELPVCLLQQPPLAQLIRCCLFFPSRLPCPTAEAFIIHS